ncbi:MAG: FtsW/RodA/SpoVE family cell cycle protein [Candidatus Paceibacterota bacterium]
MKNKFIFAGHRADYVLLGVILFLVLAGFLFLASASSDIAKIKYNDSFFFLSSQFLKGLLPGLIGFCLGYFMYYRKWKKFAPLLLLLNIILMILVFTPFGFAAKGSYRWINLGPFSFQPSELLKITFILYLASLFSSISVKRLKQSWTSYGLFLFVSCVVSVLIFIQPATTMAVIIIGAGAVIFFFSGASFKHIALTAGLALSVVLLLAIFTPYRLHRVAPFLNAITDQVAPSLSLQGASADSFHVDQSRIAIGTGGISGVGFGKSTSKYSVLPEPMGDSIFSVIAEEFGFIGSLVVIGLYLIFFWRSSDIMLHMHDDFAKLVVLGFSSIIMIQTFIHIAANSGILPFTGVPLPFISYGGTALAVSLTMMGIIANISRHTTHSKSV